MCETTPPELPVRSVFLAARTSSGGDYLSKHLKRLNSRAHHVAPGGLLAQVQLHKPDWLLLAPAFDDEPEINGIALCRAVRALPQSGTKCVLLLPPDFDKYLSAFYADISGYLPEKASEEEIEIALTRLMAGERHLNIRMLSELASAHTPGYQSHIAALSKREREVFRQVGYGYQTPEIAARLFISAKTVETHKMHIAEKLKLRSAREVRGLAMHLVQGLPLLRH